MQQSISKKYVGLFKYLIPVFLIGGVAIASVVDYHADTIIAGKLSVGSNAAPSSSALLQVTSSTKGSVPAPGMSTVNMNAISSPVEGLQIYNTNAHFPYFYNGSGWHSLVSVDGTQTVTGKTIDGDDNTVQDLGISSLKTVVGNASKFLSFDASGNPEALKAVPTGTVVGTTDSQTLTTKTISGASNTITNIPLSSFTNLGTTTTVLHGNASGSPTFGAVSLTADVSGTLAETNGGTGQSAYTLGDLLYSSASNTLSKLAGNITTTKKFLSQTGNGSVSAAPAWGQPACSDISNAVASCSTDATNASNISSGTLAVARGGTGITSGTSGGILSYTASGTLASSGALTANQLVIGGGAGVVPSSLAAGSQYSVLTMGAANPGYGAVNLAQSAAVTGTLPVANGGTGQSSATDGQLLIGNSSTTGFSKATLTAGSNITITNGNGSISIAASSGAGAPTWTYVSQSSTLNPAALGRYYKLSGASFTITLPTAVGVDGQQFVFEHAGTSFTQVYTFNTTSSQTMNGSNGAVASGSFAMYTLGEITTFTSDGANWRVDHKAEVPWTSYGSNATPSGFGTVTSFLYRWRRSGDSMYIQGSWTNGTTAGTTAQLALPGGTIGTLSQSAPVGYFSRTATTVIAAVAAAQGNAYLTFRSSGWGSADTTGSNTANSSEVVAIDAGPIVISGWQPN